MGAYVTINPTPSGDITGSGTPNYLAMFTSANVIGDSVIYQSGSKVYVSAANTFAVNTSTPSFSVGYDSQTITIAGVSYSAIESSYISVGTSINSQAMAASATASVASVYLGARSRGTFASPTAVQSGDSIHSFYSVGHDGTDYAISTAIEHIVGGTVGANQVPGRIKFSTANSSGTLTEAMSIYSTQQVSIGNYASPTNLRVLTIGQDTAYMSFGSYTSSTGVAAIYGTQATPSGTNYTFLLGTNSTSINAPNGNIELNYASTTRYTFSSNSINFTPTTISTGAITNFSFTVSTASGQTSGSEISNFKVNGASKTWNAGAITNQRWNYFTANTAAFASASTITYSYGFYAEKAVAGSNATITYNIGIGTDGDLLSAGNYHWQGTSTPTTTNYTSYKDAATAIFNGGDNVALSNNGTTYLDIRRGGYTSGTRSGFTFSHGNNTGQTASTEISGYLYNSYSRQWATGAITTQREHYLKTVTYSFVGASTITNAYGLYVEAATAGANATITNNYGIGTDGKIYAAGEINGNYFSIGGANALSLSSTSLQIGTSSFYTTNRIMTNGITRLETLGLTTSGITSAFVFSPASCTTQNSGVEISGYLYNSYSRQWNTGAITTQREHYLKTVTYSFVGASTITNAYGLYVEAATAGTNATITNNYAAGFGGNINIIGTPYVSGVAGVDGTFTTADAKTVTVTKGIITSIV